MIRLLFRQMNMTSDVAFNLLLSLRLSTARKCRQGQCFYREGTCQIENYTIEQVFHYNVISHITMAMVGIRKLTQLRTKEYLK